MSGGLHYRRAALDSISSPEQLGRIIQVVGGQAWLLLLSILFCFATAIFWACFGEIPTRVHGDGMMFSLNATTRAVTTPLGGQVAQVMVAPGETVRRGQVLIRLDQADLRQKRDDAERTLAKLQAQRAKVESFWTLFLAHDQVSTARERNDLIAVVSSESKVLASEQSMLDGYRWLLSRGFAKRITVEGQIEKIFSTQAQINQNTLSISQLDARTLQDVNQRDTALRDYELQIIEAEEKRDEAELDLRRGSAVLSPDDGKVATLSAEANATLASGATVATLDFRGPELEALVFIPASDGKRVRPGMQVNVVPSTAHAEKDGTLRGYVEAVSDIPESSESMMRLLNNAAIVQQFMKDGAPLLVTVRLRRDPSTRSGYRWTSGNGPNITLSSGTLLEGEVQVSSQRPIVLVLPLLRRWTGLHS